MSQTYLRVQDWRPADCGAGWPGEGGSPAVRQSEELSGYPGGRRLEDDMEEEEGRSHTCIFSVSDPGNLVSEIMVYGISGFRDKGAGKLHIFNDGIIYILFFVFPHL